MVDQKFDVQSAYDSASIGEDFNEEDMSVSVRKIKNGFIVSRSWTEGKGEDRQWKNEEEYYSENPIPQQSNPQ